MTRAAILALCALTAPAWGDSTSVWPGTHGGFTMELRMVNEGAHVASVDLRNNLTPMGTPDFAVLRLDGLTVLVSVDHRDGDNPDTVSLHLPEGFIAIPASLELDEGEAGTIAIFALADMVTG